MVFKEVCRDLFSVNFKKYTPAHCISQDCHMGAGIAVPMKKKFKLSGLKNAIDNLEVPLTIPNTFYHNGVLNLITKKKYWHKPTYDSMGMALVGMFLLAQQHNIKYIAMPKIGCGLDGLSWPRVRQMIQEVFEETDIEILVCHK
jgi:O-acetyl-ADP-ribose deacetylase (regulator of RNase III)